MSIVKVYNQEGKEVSEIELNEAIFGLPWNADLVYQAIRTYMANQRQIVASTKTRAQVRGGGRKPWRQKGTGRARHGSIRSPLWKGGGVTFGPTSEKNFKLKINKKMARKAFLIALSAKAKDNEILFLDNLEITSAKTREMAHIVANFPQIKTGLLVLPSFAKATESKKNDMLKNACRNLSKLEAVNINNLNIFNVLKHQYLIFTKSAIEYLNKKYATPK